MVRRAAGMEIAADSPSSSPLDFCAKGPVGLRSLSQRICGEHRLSEQSKVFGVILNGRRHPGEDYGFY
jgi:hypothetical protein